MKTRYRITVQFAGQPEAGILGSSMTKLFVNRKDAEASFTLFAGDSYVLSVELQEEKILRHT